MAKRLLVILGSARSMGAGERVGTWVQAAVEADERFEIEYVRANDLALPFFDEPVSPNWNQGVYVNKKGADWAAKVGASDAVLFITPEYNHSYSALIKNAIDWVGPEWKQKPAGIITYSVSPYGGVRAAEHMRNVLAEIDTHTVKEAISIPFIDAAIDEKGTALNEHLPSQLKNMLDAIAADAS